MDAFKLHGAPKRAAGFSHLIRRATVEDIGDIIDIAREAYGSFNEPFAQAFIRQNIDNPCMLIIRTEIAFGCAYFNDWPFEFNTRDGAMEFLAARPGVVGARHAYYLFGKMIEWAQQNGVTEFVMRSKTDKSLRKLAEMYGMKEDTPSFSLKFNPVVH